MKFTADRVIVFFLLGISQFISLEEKEGVTAKAKFRRKLTSGALLTFLLTCSLHNRLLEVKNKKNAINCVEYWKGLVGQL